MTTEHKQSRVDVLSKEGLRSSATISAEESHVGTELKYRIKVSYEGGMISEESEVGFFDALCKARLVLERQGALLCCFGASEDVYPSPMQEAMGPALLAYRTELGRQALSKNIVNILDSDVSVRPSTVEQQRAFHKRWLQSLAAGQK
jgi:hypothetical protein